MCGHTVIRASWQSFTRVALVTFKCSVLLITLQFGGAVSPPPTTPNPPPKIPSLEVFIAPSMVVRISILLNLVSYYTQLKKTKTHNF